MRFARKILLISLEAACSIFSLSALAAPQETVTYKYDALGRLVEATISGGPNTGVKTEIGFDAAGNRSQYKVTGAAAQRPSKVIVLPLNGFTIIPIYE